MHTDAQGYVRTWHESAQLMFSYFRGSIADRHVCLYLSSSMHLYTHMVIYTIRMHLPSSFGRVSIMQYMYTMLDMEWRRQLFKHDQASIECMQDRDWTGH